MTRDPYLELAAALPRPTPQQTAAFAEFVAGAHSWYKHLPAWPPGAPFAFFLDPNAGRSLVHLPSGENAFVDKTDERDRFHYTWMLTTEYRARFGHWSYATSHGPGLFCGSNTGGWARVDSIGSVLSEEGEWISLPSEVVLAGTCMVTAVVHHLFKGRWAANERHLVALEAFRARARERPDDPEVRRYALLLERLGTWEDGTPRIVAGDEELEPFILAERGRLRDQMLQAMERVAEVVWGPGSASGRVA